MGIVDFQKKTEAELLQLANDCLVAMDTAGVEQKAAYLLQAQLYMTQAGRLGDAQVADRDFKMAERGYKMEKGVIWLIGGEIVLSIFGIWLGFHEGNKQNDILGKLNASASTTASASAAQAVALPQLVEEQKKSLGSLSDMNDKLKGSLKQTTSMAAAMQTQLGILQAEQAERQAELAKKPKLELYVGDVPLNSLSNMPLPVRERTTTKTTWNISLRNSGTASATKGTVRAIVFAKDVTLECSSPFQRLFEPDPDASQHIIVIPFEYDRANGNLPMSITANYPVGQPPFVIYFNVDAEEIPVGTPLGAMTVTPPKP